MYNGIINVYKEKGFTSHDVVAKLRGILKQKKIGHTGTLDPDAEGVLPVCLGKGTKLCDMLEDKDKTYEAVLLLGKATDTQDISGEVINEAEVTCNEKTVVETIYSFVGEYKQIPPMYSAIKVNGKKLYELAREGKIIERNPRQVHIYNIDIKNIELPRITIEVKCSKGTYIRTLCHDIGNKLGCFGCMEKLLRTKANGFVLDESLTLQQIEQLRDEDKLLEKIVPIEFAFEKYDSIVIDKEYNKLVYNGNKFISKNIKNASFDYEKNAALVDKVKVYDEENNFLGLYEYQISEECYKPVKMFLGD